MAKLIPHVGLHAYRISRPCNALEKAFATHWQNENNPPSFLNHGRGVLDHLLYKASDQSEFSGHSTERERSVAASVIQWLGTGCGRCFLEEVLQDCGLVIQEAETVSKSRERR
jgi:hypothetical protein